MGTLPGSAPRRCTAPAIPGDAPALVPASPEAGDHQREDHEVVIGGSRCRVDVVTSHLPACEDTVMARRGPWLLPREGTVRGQQGDSVLSLPAIPLYSKLMPLRTVVSMLGGNTFHHLYSSPSTGSVPAGQLRQPGDRRGQPCTGVPPTYPCQPLQVPQSPLGDNDGDVLMGPVGTRGDTPAPISPPSISGCPGHPSGTRPSVPEPLE